MLSHISIQNFTIVDDLSLDLSRGMTTLTGETGAGKSILIDALEYALGARGDAKLVRQGASQATLSLVFDLTGNPGAQAWLVEQEFEHEQECLLRRTISADGRSKHYINGQLCAQAQLRALGNLLIHIHGQHANQALFSKAMQLSLFHAFARAQLGKPFLQCEETVHRSFQAWQNLLTEKESLLQKSGDPSQIEFLQYQLNELETLNLVEGELAQLEQEQTQLVNVDQLRDYCQRALNYLDTADDNNASEFIHQANTQMQAASHYDSGLENVLIQIDTIQIQLQELINELRPYNDQFNADPERLQVVEQRLTRIYDLARKHRTGPTQLIPLQKKLSTQLETLNHADERLASIDAALENAAGAYEIAAEKLAQLQQRASTPFNKIITSQLHELGMSACQFNVHFQRYDHFAIHGRQSIEFWLQSNPGQPEQPISKIASGGELSRISLTIQVAIQQLESTPTLVFDEVDVGIGGGTAEIVGKLLKQLGKRSQVLCITHLPQVATQGDQHLKVSKQSQVGLTYSHIEILNHEQRIQETARMLGGVKLTKQTLAHAKEMLN